VIKRMAAGLDDPVSIPNRGSYVYLGNQGSSLVQIGSEAISAHSLYTGRSFSDGAGRPTMARA
jgi:hypothetical protein